MTFIKEELDSRVNSATENMAILEKQLPTFFRLSKTATSHLDHKPLPDNATPAMWRQQLVNTQLDVKVLFEGFGDCRQTFIELTRTMMVLFKELKEGYDIQGRALLALARKEGIDFDQLLEMYLHEEEKHDEELNAQINEALETFPS